VIPSKERWWFRLSIVTNVHVSNHWPQIAIECLRTPMLKSIGVGHFAAKFGEEGIARCEPNFYAI